MAKDINWIVRWYSLCMIIAMIILWLNHCSADTDQLETASVSNGKSILGVSFSPKGVVSCVNDTSLRLADANILWGISKEEYLFKLIFLPPYCVDYNAQLDNSVVVPKGKFSHGVKPEKIMDLFKDALGYYFPDVPEGQLLEEFKLVSAAVRPNDTDPKMACWYFSCARYKNLRPELVAREKFKNHGLVFMGMAVSGIGEILSSGYQMYFCDEDLLKKILEKSESIEDIASLISVLPPFFDNKDKGATKKGPSPFIIGGMFKRAQRACGIQEVPLTADKFSCNKLLVEGWLLTVAPDLQ